MNLLIEVTPWLLAVFFVLEMARIMMEGAFGNMRLNIWEPIGKLGLASLLCNAGFVYSYFDLIDIFFINPFKGIYHALMGIKDIYTWGDLRDAYQGITDAFKNPEGIQTKTGWIKSAILHFLQSIRHLNPLYLLGDIFFWLSKASIWIVSIYQKIVFALLATLGPIFIPTLIFKPFQNMFFSWMKRIIVIGMWGILALILFQVIGTINLMSNMKTSILRLDSFFYMVSSAVLLLSVLSLPSLASAIFGGVMNTLSPQSVGNKITSTIGKGSN